MGKNERTEISSTIRAGVSRKPAKERGTPGFYSWKVREVLR